MTIVGGHMVESGDLTINDMYRAFLIFIFGTWTFLILGSAS